MGIMTISLKDSVEKKFRRAVNVMYGKRKGVIGKAMSDALEKWSDEKLSENSSKNLIQLMEKGHRMGRFKMKSRDELHER